MRPMFRIPLTLSVIFLFVHSEALALGPGVPYGGGARTISGTYTGILLPDTAGGGGSDPVDEDAFIGSNALGLFSLVGDSSGVVNGAAIFFLDDVAYNSTIIGLSDSQKGQIFAVLDLTSVATFIDTTSSGDTFTFVKGGSGRLIASTSGRGSRDLTGTASVIASFTATTYSFIVDGVQQTSSTSPITAFSLTNATSGT